MDGCVCRCLLTVDGNFDEMDARILLLEQHKLMHPIVFNDMSYIIHSMLTLKSNEEHRDYLEALFKLADVEGVVRLHTFIFDRQ